MTTVSIFLYSLSALVLFQSVCLIFVLRRSAGGGFAAVIIGYVSQACLLYIVNYLCQGSPAWGLAANGFVFILYGLLCAYLFGAGTHLDYAVISVNFFWISARESFRVIFATLRWEPLAAALLIGLWLFFAASTMPFPAAPLSFEIFRTTFFMAAAALYGALFLLPLDSYDEVMLFLRSFRRYRAKIKPGETDLPDIGTESGAFPFIHSGADVHSGVSGFASSASRPHVFLIMMESFNARFVEERSPEGHVYTPSFNSLIAKGVYVERFYANSVQTIPGQTATFFSLLPPLKGNIFQNYRTLSLLSLPQVLTDAGYQTHFFQGEKHLNIDNTRPFLKAHGFGRVERIQDYMGKEDADDVWGWGPSDSVMYRRFFEYLDKNGDGRNQPVFAAIATINNHMPFRVPKRKRLLYPRPATMRERYADSLHVADAGLPVFFEELAKRPHLKDSIVIVTGDHSYPTGDHGIVRNETAFYEESFRVPLLILREGLTPQRISQTVHSQLDIAPTLLDILQLDVGPNPFQGVSVMSSDPARPVYTIQPYGGVYVGIVTGDYKYVRHLATGREYLFSLREDPEERCNLIGSSAASAQMPSFHSYLRYVTLNQYLIESNRIWRGLRATS